MITTANPLRSASARISWTVLVLPAVATLLISLVFWHDMQATDDLRYARAAVSVLPGQSPTVLNLRPEHHDARIALIYPLTAVLWTFGASDVSLAMLPLFCSVLAASLVAWLAAWFWGKAAGLVAGLLYAVFPLTISLSTFFVPEPILGFEICLATALFLWGVEGRAGNPRRFEFLAGVVVGIAYLTTEAGALMLPVFYLHLLVERRLRRRDAALLAGFVVVLLAELGFHWALHGNPLYRSTLAAQYQTDPLLVAANRDLAYRLFKTVPAMFVYPNPDFGFFGPLLMLAGLYGLLRWRAIGPLFLIWAAVVLLFYNFMTVSLRHYIVLPVTARLLAPACLPLLVLSAKLLVDLWNAIARSSARFVTYGGHALLAGCALGLTASSLLVMYLEVASPSVTRAVAKNAKAAAAFLQRHSSIVLVTDVRSTGAIQFYRNFNPRDSFLGFEEASRIGGRLQAVPGKPAFVMLDGPITHESEIAGARYGRGFLPPEDRAALPEFLPSETAQVFSARWPEDPLLRTLLGYAPIRSLVGETRARLAEKLFAGSPALGEVQVFPVGQRRGRVGQANGRQ